MIGDRDIHAGSVSVSEPQFTGEFFVPGKAGARIEADHIARYVFASTFAPSKSVLDIACGEGYGARTLIEAGAKSYVGVDLNADLVAHARQTYAFPQASFELGDLRTYRAKSNPDLITCFETIEHVGAYREALANLFTLLAPGGLLLISSPNRPITSPSAITLEDKPDNEFHIQEFTPVELRMALTAAGFRVRPQVYGQRSRIPLASYRLQQLRKRLTGDPDETASAAVRHVRLRTPRYFVLIAYK